MRNTNWLLYSFIFLIACGENNIEDSIKNKINWPGHSIKLDSGYIHLIKYSGTKYSVKFSDTTNIQFTIKSDFADKSISLLNNGNILVFNTRNGNIKDGRMVEFDEYNQIIQDFWFHANKEYCQNIFYSDGSFINTFKKENININCIDTPKVILNYVNEFKSYELVIHSETYPLMFIDILYNFQEPKDFRLEASLNKDWYIIPKRSFIEDSLKITFYFKDDENKIIKTIKYSTKLPKVKASM